MAWVQLRRVRPDRRRRVPDARPAGRRAQGGRRRGRATTRSASAGSSTSSARRQGAGARSPTRPSKVSDWLAQPTGSSSGQRVAAARARPRARTGHAHSHAPAPDADRRWLGVALGLILGFMVVEVVAGLLADSLALLSDAAHMLTDAGAIALALVAARLAARPPGGRFTFGLGRAEILSAQINGAALLVLAGVIAWEAHPAARRPAGRRGRRRARRRPRRRRRERRRGLGAVARRAPLAQRRGRARARAHRPLRVARRRARRPARADRGPRAARTRSSRCSSPR